MRKRERILNKQYMSKTFIKKMKRKLVVGAIIEGCNYHIGPITEIDFDTYHVYFKSLFNGNIRGCSLRGGSCGVRKIKTKEQNVIMKIWNEFGIDGIYLYHNVLEP